MSNGILQNIARFFLLLLTQVLFLKRLSVGWEGYIYINVFIHPLFILLLPLRTPRVLVLLLAFAMGILVDLFYDTPGLNAAACTFIGYARSAVLNLLEPRDGYNVNYSPTAYRMGNAWFLRYAAIMMGLCLLIYFSLDAFSPVFIGMIAIKTLFSFVFSMIFILMLVYVFNPKD